MRKHHVFICFPWSNHPSRHFSTRRKLCVSLLNRQAQGPTFWGATVGAGAWDPGLWELWFRKEMVFSKFSMWQCVKTCQNLVPLVNIKIAGINRYWSIPMSFPVDKLIRFDKYPSIFGAPREVTHTCEAQRSEMDGRIMEDVSKLVCLRTYGIGLRKQRKPRTNTFWLMTGLFNSMGQGDCTGNMFQSKVCW